MALHAALAAPAAGADAAPRRGFLASARGVRLHVARIDAAPAPLVVTAARLAGDDGQALYRFTLHDAAGRTLVDGRATVVLDHPLNPPSEAR
jgi:predicted hotdog family 3-hydroxylacyl-ACP dehydratase